MIKLRREPCTQTAEFQYCTISHAPPPPTTAGLEQEVQPAIMSTDTHFIVSHKRDTQV